jgi:dihydrofolate synthase/folylpolyglutamate synthase
MENLDSLPAWLDYIDRIHFQTIDLGLDRVRRVYQNLDVSFDGAVITVGGTNGKGSTCALLEAIFLAGGYRVGLYTSPHLVRFNERVRICGQMVSDEALINAFHLIEKTRGDISLSYFEFTTLAALYLFKEAKLDVIILEVGLGGRLDAVNVVDSDVAIVTSVDLDHMDYLGDTREKIGFEKAGIFRSGRVAICSDPVPPTSLIEHASAIGADLWLFGRDFNYAGDKLQWNFAGRTRRRNSLAYPALRGANQLLNASAALAALEVLHSRYPLGADEIRRGLMKVNIPARFQILPGKPAVILDVAHNPHAAATLVQNLANMGFYPVTHVVFGAMQDKDIKGIVRLFKGKVDHWYITDLPLSRAASKAEIIAMIMDEMGYINETLPPHFISSFTTPNAAFVEAKTRASESDRIVVFGSFLTVAGVLEGQKILV